MRISDWSSDVCSSDLHAVEHRCLAGAVGPDDGEDFIALHVEFDLVDRKQAAEPHGKAGYLKQYLAHTFNRSEEHTSELQSLMRNSYAVFCLKNKTPNMRISTAHKKTQEKHHRYIATHMQHYAYN